MKPFIIALALTLPAASASAGSLPIAKGNYAANSDPCQYRDFSQYQSQIDFDGQNLNSSTRSRKISSIEKRGAGYAVTLIAEGNGFAGDNMPKTSFRWTITPIDADHFRLRPDSNEWDGQPQTFHRCGPVAGIFATVPPLDANGDPAPSPRHGTAATKANVAPGPVNGGAPDLGFAGGSDGDEAGDVYQHNGSAMWVFRRHGVIAYNQPKASIAGAVRPGAVLFRGTFDRTHARGTAYVFKNGCAPAPYAVNGRFTGDRSETLILEGAAPIHDRASCAILGYTTKSGNARLVLKPDGAMLE